MIWGQLLVLYLNAFIGIGIFPDEKFKKFVDLQTKRQIFLLLIHYYQLKFHQIGFLFDISQKKIIFQGILGLFRSWPRPQWPKSIKNYAKTRSWPRPFQRYQI
jgi:hypothetical protein